VASGVDAPLSSCSHVFYRGAQAGAATRRDAAAAGKKHLADEQKNKMDITSFMCTVARYPSRRRTFEEFETWPSLGGADSRFSRCCAVCASDIKPRRDLRRRRPAINIFVSSWSWCL